MDALTTQSTMLAAVPTAAGALHFSTILAMAPIAFAAPSVPSLASMVT